MFLFNLPTNPLRKVRISPILLKRNWSSKRRTNFPRGTLWKQLMLDSRSSASTLVLLIWHLQAQFGTNTFLSEAFLCAASKFYSQWLSSPLLNSSDTTGYVEELFHMFKNTNTTLDIHLPGTAQIKYVCQNEYGLLETAVVTKALESWPWGWSAPKVRATMSILLMLAR